MKSRTWLRIASLLLAVHTIAHTLGTLNDPQVPGAAALMNSMRNFHFDAMGWDRTAWDFFRGLGLLFSVSLAVLTVLAWQAGDLSERDPLGARPIVITLLAANVLITALSWFYFFIVPVVLAALTVICLALALRVPKTA